MENHSVKQSDSSIFLLAKLRKQSPWMTSLFFNCTGKQKIGHVTLLFPTSFQDRRQCLAHLLI